MVHKDDLFPAGTDQVIAGQGSDNLIIIVQDGIGTETALDYNLTNIIEVIIQVEVMKVG